MVSFTLTEDEKNNINSKMNHLLDELCSILQVLEDESVGDNEVRLLTKGRVESLTYDIPFMCGIKNEI